ncbi:MAG: hypothetical protein H7147_02745 [Frankiaceae bacterium]|nr:hypothetical protein [Arenimonas sp.]
MSHSFLGPIFAFAGRLRFPTLFLITAGLFVFDLVVPDFVPFIDEIMLGLGTLILSSWKRGRGEPGPPDLPPPPPR